MGGRGECEATADGSAVAIALLSNTALMGVERSSGKGQMTGLPDVSFTSSQVAWICFTTAGGIGT